MADFYDAVIDQVSSVSHVYSSGNNKTLSSTLRSPEITCKRDFERNMRQTMYSFESNADQDTINSFDTFLVPKLQMATYGIKDDTIMLQTLFHNFQSRTNWSFKLCSGYLNFSDTMTKSLVTCSNRIEILTSSPQANGFFSSTGVSRYIPSAYTYLTCNFLRMSQGRNLSVSEYYRKGWTWHGKGFTCFFSLSFN